MKLFDEYLKEQEKEQHTDRQIQVMRTLALQNLDQARKIIESPDTDVEKLSRYWDILQRLNSDLWPGLDPAKL